LAQGDFSRLCGLYSALNAIQLALWTLEPSREQLEDLFKAGVRHLLKRRQLARVMAVGMDDEVWLELSEALTGHANQLFDTSLALEPILAGAPANLAKPHKLTATRAIKLIKTKLATGTPVLCLLGGALEHYTVFTGYTQQRLTMFDSSGYRWIEQRSIGDGPNSAARHWLDLSCARALVDSW
jgi:hypothetical protein